MEFPVYCIINDKAVKAVKTRRGDVEILVYYPEEDKFRRDMQFLDYFYVPTPSQSLATDTVSKKEFEAYVSELRQKSKITRRKEDRQKQNGVPDHIVDNVKGEKSNNPDIRQGKDLVKKWTLEGYDTYACEFYQIKGLYDTKSEAIAAARKIKKEDGEWIYIVDPSGSHERLR